MNGGGRSHHVTPPPAHSPKSVFNQQLFHTLGCAAKQATARLAQIEHFSLGDNFLPYKCSVQHGKAHPTMHSEGFDEEASTCAVLELHNCRCALFSFNPPQNTAWGDRATETVKQPFMDHSVGTEDSNLANQSTRHCHNKFIHASKVRTSLHALSLIVFAAKWQPARPRPHKKGLLLLVHTRRACSSSSTQEGPAPPRPHKKGPVGPAVVLLTHRTVTPPKEETSFYTRGASLVASHTGCVWMRN